MKNQRFFFLLIGLLCNFSVIEAQSVNVPQHFYSQQNQETSSVMTEVDKEAFDQSCSPLMMFSDEEKSPSEETLDPRAAASKSVGARGAASADSSSDAARGTASGLAEEGEDESSLTLDHFRTALAQNPTATRFVIVEEEEGGISIQPRVAATSRLALRKNQAENTTIVDELRNLLVIKHGGSSEIVASFFDEVSSSENMPLSAEDLRNILNKSDVAQKPISSKKTAPQKTPLLHASESEVTSDVDDSNVDESLGTDIRSHLQTLEKITLAESLSDKSDKAVADFKKLQKDQKAERRKKREQKVLASALESDTEGYMTPGTFLKSAVLKTAQAEVATSLLQGSTSLSESKKLSAAERDVDDFTRIAEGKRTQAREVSLAANKAKKKAAAASGKANFEQENSAYAEAEEAWNDTAAAYQAAIKKAIKAVVDARELIASSEEAIAHLLYWRSAALEVNARKLEQTSPAIDNINLHQAEALESAWHAAHQSYQEAIAKAETVVLTDEVEEWRADRANAETKKTFWTTTITDQDTKQRTTVEALQIQALQLATEATAAGRTIDNEADTIEANHWTTAIQKGVKAETAWQKVTEICKQTLSKSLARFKDSWMIALKKAEDKRASWSAKIAFLESQKAESITRADQQEADERVTSIQVKIVSLNKEVKAKVTAVERENQEEANAGVITVHNKVATATSSVDVARGRVTTARQFLQQAKERAATAVAGIREAEEQIATLTITLNGVQAKIQDARARAAKQKYSFRNAVGISHSKRDAIEDESQAERHAAAIMPILVQVEKLLAKMKREDTTRAEAAKVSEAEANLAQSTSELAQATSELAQLKQEEANVVSTAATLKQAEANLVQLEKEKAEAIRWASISSAERAARIEKLQQAAEREAQIEELRQLSSESKARADASSSNSSEQYRWKNSSDSFNESAEYLANAMTARSLGHGKNEALWREAVARARESAEQSQLSAQAYASKNENEGARLNMVAKLLLVQAKSTKNKARAFEAEDSGNRERARKWNEVEQQNQQSVEPYIKAAQAHAAGKTNEGNLWNYAGLGFYLGADKLGKALEAVAAGKAAETVKWREAAKLYQQSVEPHIQSTRAYAAGKTNEGNSWNYAGAGFYWGADKLGKAIEAEAAGKPAEAVKWREAARLQQRSVENFTQAARAYAAEKRAEGKSWYQAGDDFYNGAEKLEKVLEAEAAGKPTEIVKWREAAKLFQQSVEPHIQSTRAYEEGKTDEEKSWNNTWKSFNNAADKLVKALEAEAAGKAAVAAKWREAAGLQQRSAEHFTQAARAYAAGKTVEGSLWNNVGESFKNAADRLVKALEAEASGKPAVAAKWREAAGVDQRAVEPFTQAARAFAIGTAEKKAEGTSWFNAGNGFYNRALRLEQAIEAEAAGKAEAGQKYREAALEYQRSVEIYNQSAKAYEGTTWFNGGQGRGERLKVEGDAIFNEASRLATAAETLNC